MNKQNNPLKKLMLLISALLAIALLVSSAMLLLEVNVFEILRRGATLEEPRTEEEQRLIDLVPPTIDYTLRRRATPYQIELFEILIEDHNRFSETRTNETLMNYAESIVRNFVADFFTFSNKSSRTDIGGLQFLATEITDSFNEFALNTFYLYLNQYISLFGNESLPRVESTTILSSGHGQHGLSLDEWPWTEYIEVIIIDIEWAYAFTTLPYIDDFQTSARFILLEENSSIRIHAILPLPVTNQY